MIWLLFIIGFVPLFILPRVIFNAFSLPQIFALGLLSSLGVIGGVASGIISLATPCLLAILYAIYMVLSITWTTPTHNGVKELGLQIPLILLFLLGSTYITLSNSFVIALSVALAATICSIYSFGQTKGIDWIFPNDLKKGGKVTNAIGTIGNPNFLSAYLVSSFWLSVYACFAIHYSLIFLPLSCGYALYLTKSRAGAMGMVGSTLFIAITAGFLNCYPGGFIVSTSLSFLLISTIPISIYLFRKHWDTFWNKEIDPQGEQIWYATLRYRFCYWWSALELIKQKPVFGWGMWTYRREVYQAQSKINDKHPGFLNPKRYITPQPREVHNDYLEHLVEFGFVGASIFGIIVVLVYKLGFVFLLSQVGIPFVLMLLLLTNLTGILFNALYFFALRIPSSGINFWITCAMIVGISSSNIATFSTGIIPTLIVTFIVGGFFWNCICKRVLASYWFSEFGKGKDVTYTSLCLNKVLKYAPYDSLYRTYAMSSIMDAMPEIGNYHAEVITSHYDGMTPLWSALFNRAYASLRDSDCRFNTPVFYLKNSLAVLPEGFEPTHQLLTGSQGIASKARILDARRARMREVSQEVFWKIKAMESDKQNLQLSMENIQLKGNQIALQQQQVLIEEKKRLNVPDDWVFNTMVGKFMSPEEQDQFVQQQQQNGPMPPQPQKQVRIPEVVEKEETV